MKIKLEFKPSEKECSQYDEIATLQNQLGIFVPEMHKAIYRYGLEQMLADLRKVAASRPACAAPAGT